ncbi:hypothetical protein K488DRAFT_90305 [Vararia minispora EC-137]|uniref:Uncharacterized protein n=1 Tax=Vararia minispora EC-137 TaxID=1314806 RepID=A0ACB8Q8A2_9AGAM|nr:hypothetical protein K488DRAFT_90305 [Vararia minispora EC-137]
MSDLSSVEDAESDEDANEGEDLEGEQSDFEEKPVKRRRTTTNGTPKRTNAATPPTGSVNASASATKKGRSRLQGRLENMLAMPLDVLYEIFCLLQPADLLALSRTSKNFRTILMTRNSATVGAWKSARANMSVPGPEPPSNMSEPAWANLLYGGSHCWSCSSKNVQRIDFGLRRRMCMSCAKSNLVYKSTFKRKCPELDESLMDLLPYTHYGGWSHGHASNGRFYWMPSLYDMSRRVAELRKGRNGLTAVRNFREERLLIVDEIMQGVNEYEKWAEKVGHTRSEERSQGKEHRRNQIMARLIDSGYDKIDMGREFKMRSEFQSDKPLTETGWKRMQPNLEAYLNAVRNERLANEKKQLFDQRSRKAVLIYRDFLNLLFPQLWLYLPTTTSTLRDHCQSLPSLYALLTMTSEPTAKDWEKAATVLPSDVSTGLLARMRELTSLVPDPSIELPQQADLPLLSDDPERRRLLYSRLAVMDTARLVFRWSSRNTCVFGRDVFHSYEDVALRCGGAKLEFQPRASLAVECFAEYLGMNKNKVSVAELDASCAEKLVQCLSCKGSDSKKCFNWRGYANHYAFAEESTHVSPEFVIMSADDPNYKTVKTMSDTYLSVQYAKRFWACTHCADYHTRCDLLWGAPPGDKAFITHGVSISLALGTRQDVVAHAKLKHDVTDPADDVDIFFYPPVGTDRAAYSVKLPDAPDAPKAIAPAMSSAARFRCKHCPANVLRTFILDGVKSHIRAKHRTDAAPSDIVLERDFIAV